MVRPPQVQYNAYAAPKLIQRIVSLPQALSGVCMSSGPIRSQNVFIIVKSKHKSSVHAACHLHSLAVEHFQP